jgi:hypothetical protein
MHMSSWAEGNVKQVIQLILQNLNATLNIHMKTSHKVTKLEASQKAQFNKP